MIAVVLAIALATALGVPLVALVRRDAKPGVLLGGGLLLGLGCSALLLFVLPWSRAVVVSVIVIAAVGAWIVARKHVTFVFERENYLLRAIAAILFAGYVALATIGPTPEADYVTDWGLKGRTFFEHRGVDWQFLSRPDNAFTHPDYPILLPLTLDYAAIVADEWNDPALGLITAAYALGLLLVLRGLLGDELSTLRADLALLALLGVSCSPYIGLGEGPLLAYGTAAILLLRRGLREHDPRDVQLASLLLGFAALSKNEGFTLLIACVIAATLFGKRLALQLWPAVVLALTWLIPRELFDLQTDLTTTGVVERVINHVRDPKPYIAAMSRYAIGHPLLWIGVILLVIASFRALVAHERFAILVIALQYCAFTAAYLATPHDIDWHVRWSLERVVNQLTPALGFILLVHALPLLGRREEVGVKSASTC